VPHDTATQTSTGGPRLAESKRTLVIVALLLAATGVAVFAEVQTPSCRTALLVIDVQVAWLNSSAVTVDGVRIEQKTAQIVEAARPSDIPIVFIVDVSQRSLYSERRLSIARPLEALDGDLVIEKTRPNGFERTTLADDLRARGVTTLLITGLASQHCVQSTVDGALREGFEVIIVQDGHTGLQAGRVASSQNWRWERTGLQVVPSAEIDFAALCSPQTPPTRGTP